MLWGDLELKATSEGVEYVVFTERATKTRSGESADTRAFQPKIFEQPGIIGAIETFQYNSVCNLYAYGLCRF